MKSFLLSLLFVASSFCLYAQNVTALMPGRYESKLKSSQSRWERGDVIIIDDSHYRLSSDNEVGEYRLSVAAQRIFFTSGPLKSAFTKVALKNNQPVMIFPPDLNQDLGLTAEVWASKQ